MLKYSFQPMDDGDWYRLLARPFGLLAGPERMALYKEASRRGYNRFPTRDEIIEYFESLEGISREME